MRFAISYGGGELEHGGVSEATAFNVSFILKTTDSGALGNLAAHAGADVQEQLVEGGAVEPLMKLLCAKDEAGRELAIFALAALAEHRKADLVGPLKQGKGLGVT